MDSDAVLLASATVPWAASAPQRCCRSCETSTRTVSRLTPKQVSCFERIISTCPPIFESLLLQLPTSAILDLYHTSTYLRSFLQKYPAAWHHLSFRYPNPARLKTRQSALSRETNLEEVIAAQSEQLALDRLFHTVILPYGTRIKSLELDHTSISGNTLICSVLHSRRDTLQHLSVRGCRNVSLKYHIVPFLNLFNLQMRQGSASTNVGPVAVLALKSLYIFRCKHHRRRPYSPSSLLRRDSDSLPTHDFIRICHDLEIWSDIAWCPSPGGRCNRRKDYSASRGGDARTEVWVTYDRLWRSDNWIGSPESVGNQENAITPGQLWKDADSGYKGEPLGQEPRAGQGEGKGLPAHLRQSYRKFVDNIKCHDCDSEIRESCEHCSIKMHCTACRKTLCANCSFARNLPGLNSGQDPNPKTYWWAPGLNRKPELMIQEYPSDLQLQSLGSLPSSRSTPSAKMESCCVKPFFSSGGSFSSPRPGVTAPATNHSRTSPLPKGQNYEDPEFTLLRSLSLDNSRAELWHILDHLPPPYGPIRGHNGFREWVSNTKNRSDCVRILCPQCREMAGWRATCQGCGEWLCIAHDVRGLSVRVCGFMDLVKEIQLFQIGLDCKNTLKSWKGSAGAGGEDTAEWRKGFQNYLEDPHSPQHFGDLQDIIPAASLQHLAGSIPYEHSVDLLVKIVQGIVTEELSVPWQPQQPETVRPLPSETEQETNCNLHSTYDWQGCRSLLCPENRSPGDSRPKCTAIARQCMLCGIYVCPGCLRKHQACECSYCKDNYACPRCSHLRTSLCRKREEDRKREERSERLEKELAEVREQLRLADEAIEHAAEFLALAWSTDAGIAGGGAIPRLAFEDLASEKYRPGNACNDAEDALITTRAPELQTAGYEIPSTE